jgi:hypothetical protein
MTKLVVVKFVIEEFDLVREQLSPLDVTQDLELALLVDT